MNTALHHRRTTEAVPHAVITRSHWSWALWLIPASAVLLCVWFFYRDYIATGPVITIYFENADGLEVKNTPLRFRGVQVGQIKGIEVAKDHQYAEVTARLTSDGRSLANTGSIFWIVRPELNVSSISGLGTLVSGAYIAVRPGVGPATNRFFGVEKEPPTEEPRALQITLVAPRLDSLQEGSQVFYRGLAVGEVLHVQLGADARNIVVTARIWEDFAPLVRPESKFWNAGGLDVHLGLFKGLNINAESPRTIISGGIEFATPPVFGSQTSNGATFDLNEKPEDKWKTWNPAISLQLSGKTPQTTNASPETMLLNK